MTKKRKSRGRRKGGKGREKMTQCAGCGKMVPISKAKKIYRRVSLVDSRLAQDLKKRGAYFPSSQIVKYYCISCSVHRGYYSPRSAEDRRKPYKKRR